MFRIPISICIWLVDPKSGQRVSSLESGPCFRTTAKVRHYCRHPETSNRNQLPRFSCTKFDAQDPQLLKIKVKAILNYSGRTTTKQLHKSSGPENSYRRVIQTCASLMRTLTGQLRGNSKISNLDDSAKKSFLDVEQPCSFRDGGYLSFYW